MKKEMKELENVNIKNLFIPEKKKTDRLKVGVIGAGKMGLLHSGIFYNLDRSILSAISENNKNIAKVIKYCIPDVKIYQNYEEMLENENLDIVVIATPVFLHKRMIENAINHNTHVFVEKPLALNGKECRSILDKSSKKKTLVGYCRRFMGTYKMAKDLIENEELGNVKSFKAHLFVDQVSRQGKGWLYNPEKSGGGVLIDLGSHAIDLFHYLFGDIIKVTATGKSIYNKKVEDYVSVNFIIKNSIFGSLEVSWSIKNYRLPELSIEIVLDNGSIIVTEKYIKIYSEKDTPQLKKGWNSFFKQDLTKNIPINIGGPEYTLEDLHFLNCIMINKKSLCDFQEGAKTNYVIDKIYTSIKNNSQEIINYEV